MIQTPKEAKEVLGNPFELFVGSAGIMRATPCLWPSKPVHVLKLGSNPKQSDVDALQALLTVYREWWNSQQGQKENSSAIIESQS